VRRHPFDPIALVFGLVFAAAAILVLAGGSLADDGDFLLPAGLFGLGIALLLQNAARSRSPRPVAPTPSDSDDPLYREALADLDAIDGTAVVRSSSGIEWTGPTSTPATAGGAGVDAEPSDETSPLSDDPPDRPGT
jgi:hypothetical protein